MLNRPRAIGQRFYGTNVSIVSYRYLQVTFRSMVALMKFMGTGKIIPNHLSNIMVAMTDKNLAVYEPPKQIRSILIYWRLPEEWAEVLYEWVRKQFLKVTVISHRHLLGG